MVLDEAAQPEGLESVEKVVVNGQGKCVHLKDGKTIHDLMSEMAREQRAFERFEQANTPIEDIFVSVVNRQKEVDKAGASQ